MATVQETLKSTSGIDIKELLESYAGKGNVKSSIDNLADGLSNADKANNHKPVAEDNE